MEKLKEGVIVNFKNDDNDGSGVIRGYNSGNYAIEIITSTKVNPYSHIICPESNVTEKEMYYDVDKNDGNPEIYYGARKI